MIAPLSSFERLQAVYGDDPKPVTPLPHVKAYCDKCETDTGTKIFRMKAGLGNACERCGRFRRGKRFMSVAEFKNNLAPQGVEGGFNELPVD